MRGGTGAKWVEGRMYTLRCYLALSVFSFSFLSLPFSHSLPPLPRYCPFLSFSPLIVPPQAPSSPSSSRTPVPYICCFNPPPSSQRSTARIGDSASSSGRCASFFLVSFFFLSVSLFFYSFFFFK
ncbi:hypothetical protein R3P38DRAFT_3068176 [Favolaschia claudopus]|uniref:Transmembrane protein n=1 Tax=Favolaschia claudopus TaxID=2862362 RepID=A0AAW0A0K8_9AGAR